MKSWRDVLPVHPAADVFPMMSGAELAELAENIKAHGMRTPVMLDERRRSLVDGRNRLDAAEAAGIDVSAFVLSANVHRRHLTTEQRRGLIEKVLRANPEQSNRHIAEQTKS